MSEARIDRLRAGLNASRKLLPASMSGWRRPCRIWQPRRNWRPVYPNCGSPSPTSRAGFTWGRRRRDDGCL